MPRSPSPERRELGELVGTRPLGSSNLPLGVPFTIAIYSTSFNSRKPLRLIPRFLAFSTILLLRRRVNFLRDIGRTVYVQKS